LLDAVAGRDDEVLGTDSDKNTAPDLDVDQVWWCANRIGPWEEPEGHRVQRQSSQERGRVLLLEKDRVWVCEKNVYLRIHDPSILLLEGKLSGILMVTGHDPAREMVTPDTRHQT
jgi:hypothetical protein